MTKPPEPDLSDPDNPEWTEEDFRRAQPPSAEMLELFKRARDPNQRAERIANQATEEAGALEAVDGEP